VALSPLFLVSILLLLVSAAVAQPPQDHSLAFEQSLKSPLPVGVAEREARKELKQILSQPEFSQVMRPPSPWDRLKQQVVGWILKQFADLFKAVAKHPTTSRIVFWSAALGALGAIAFLLFQLFLNREKSMLNLSGAPQAPTHTSDEWIQAARSASQEGDLNKAIQCLYWASIVWLQSAGTLPRTAGLTPRELLRAGTAKKDTAALVSLTSSLEKFWYRRMPATADDFAACLRSVEALGCKLE